MHASFERSPEPLPPGSEKVHSSATAAMLAHLATSPKLDPQRFSLEGEVGKGGMGAVLRIHDRLLNRRLAMKVLLEREARDADEQRLARQLLGRFLEEAQVTSQLDHPGVVPVHELGLDQNGKVWFTMRLVKGTTASQVFADAHAGTNGWTLVRALEVVLKVCDTMAYAHEKGVLHRDLKPSNVMVGRFGEVYVMDWGLAKVIGQSDRHDLRIRPDGTHVSAFDTARHRDAEDAASSVVSMDGQQLGTPSYMSPEQARSEDLDARADVYAIGAMLYELVSGRAPYTVPGMRKRPYHILEDVAQRPPARIDDIVKGVPAELIAIVERAMERDRHKRFAGVDEIAADVRAFLDHRVVKAYRTGAFVEMRLWMRRNRGFAASLIAVTAVLLISVVVMAALTAEIAIENEKSGVFVDEARLAAARRNEPGLYPAFPDKIPAMEKWLELGEQLLARLPVLEKTLEQLRRRGQLADGTTAPDGYSFVDPQDAFVHETLVRVIADLRAFEVQGRVPNVRRRLADAQTIEMRSIGGDQFLIWRDAMNAIASSDGVRATERYRNLRIGPKVGLVPLGMDPDSKLWEFVHVSSGTPGKEVPLRDGEGRIVPSGDTGIVFVLVPGDAAANPPVEPFFVAKYEVTCGQWLRLSGRDFIQRGVVVKTSPSASMTSLREVSLDSPSEDLARPLEGVAWEDANRILTEVGLCLPTLQQWELAGAGDAGVSSPSTSAPLPNVHGLFGINDELGEWCQETAEGPVDEKTGRRQALHWYRSGGFGPDHIDLEIMHLVLHKGMGLRPVRHLQP